MSTTRRRAKPAQPSVAEFAAMSFTPLPDADTLGNREKWAGSSKRHRISATLAGGVLTKTPEQLRAAVQGAGLEARTAMIETIGESAAAFRAMAKLLDGAGARAIIAMASLAPEAGQ